MTSKPNSNYMGSGLAQTLDQKSNNKIGGQQLTSNASAQSLNLNNYHVPSLDGKLIPAIPISLAIKATPPTIAVVYEMTDAKSGKKKKYIHEIKIYFEAGSENPVDITRMCDEICRKETTYLNPAFISKK
jgi:hypothetical protein